MILKRCNKLCHSSRVKVPLVELSASWFSDLTYFTWFGLLGPGWFCQITSPEQLGGCRKHVSSSDFCLWWSFLSQLQCLRRCTTVILSQRDVRSKELDLCWIDPHSDPTLVQSGVWFGSKHRFPVCMLGLVLVFFGSFPALQWPNPKSQAQVNRPYANQHPTIWSLIQQSCATLTFASCTYNWLVQMFDFQKMHKTSPDVDFESSRSPAKSESWNNPNRQCWAALHTWQYWRQPITRGMNVGN